MVTNLQWSFSKILSETEVDLCYIFEIKNDSLNYLDLTVKKINNEWKVSSYSLSK